LIEYVISVLLIMTAIFLIYYWIDFFLRKGVQVTQEEWYIKFQKAFPIADVWAAICALLGGVGLLTEKNFGLLFALLAASSIIFLALMDITFNVENKLYNLVRSSAEMKGELVGNIWFLSVGIIVIIYVWAQIVIF
jgi:hypothetical protein